MKVVDNYMESPLMELATRSGDVATTFRQMMSRLRQRCRHSLCSVLNGGHELYRARTDCRLYQECLLCGYETPGWTIDRRDRRLHLVSTQPSSAAGRR